MALTEKQCKLFKSTSPKGYDDIFDAKGLSLRCYAKTGKKTWLFQYSFNKKRNSMTFGSYPNDLALAEARTQRDIYLKGIVQGKDPKLKKRGHDVIKQQSSMPYDSVDETYTPIKNIIKSAKKRLLKMHFESGVGHIGGNLSCIDVVIILFHKLISPKDKFILSKGHSAGALYVALWSIGILKDSDLTTFHQDDTLLAGHPLPNKIKNISFATGSLGHGLSLSAGIALSKKIKSIKGQVFCLTSDGEWQEGSTWEALIFSCHHNLDNLTIIVDHNNLQGFGSTDDIASLSPLSKIINGFDLEVVTINGHSPEEILSSLKKKQNKCRMIILETNKGNGVSFMENKMEWHYLPINKDQYNKAIDEVDSV